MDEIEDFLKAHRIDEVECLVPDMAGIARGKILPAQRFLQAMGRNSLRLPEAVFVQTVTGDYPDEGIVTSEAMPDIYLVPDPSTIRLVPWYDEPTAQIICDPFYLDDTPVEIASRTLLKRSVAGSPTWRRNWNSSWSM